MKEMESDFGRKTSQNTLMNIQGFDMEMVWAHKHLCVHLNSKLDRLDNTDVLYK